MGRYAMRSKLFPHALSSTNHSREVNQITTQTLAIIMIIISSYHHTIKTSVKHASFKYGQRLCDYKWSLSFIFKNETQSRLHEGFNQSAFE